jgi:cobalt-zinc-cadmium efflux system outer membrane protein
MRRCPAPQATPTRDDTRPRMREWTSTLALLAILAAAAPAFAGPEPLGARLDGLLAEARARHPELRAMRHEADAAAERIGSAGALADPMAQMELRDVTNEMSGGSPSLLPGRVGSTRYQIRQTLPPWGSRESRRETARAGADEARLRAEATWTELALRIKTAYARWQQQHATALQTRELLQLAERMEAAAQARYASGRGAQQDVIRAQVERTTLAGELLMVEADLTALRARLNGLLARDAGAPLAPPRADLRDAAALPPVARLDPATLRERALARNPQLAADDARLRAARSGEDTVRANRYPMFTLGVAPVQQRSRIAEWELMFEVSIPLQQASRRADEREAQAMVAAAQARREATANALLAELGEQLAAFDAARRIDTLTAGTLLPQADLTVQAALAGYETGRVDFATVIDAQRQVRNAQTTLLRTRAEALMRLAEIERIIGGEL